MRTRNRNGTMAVSVVIQSRLFLHDGKVLVIVFCEATTGEEMGVGNMLITIEHGGKTYDTGSDRERCARSL